MSRGKKLLDKKTRSKQWMESFIANSGGEEEARKRIKEWTSRAGKVKGLKTGYSNKEVARKAALKRWGK